MQNPTGNGCDIASPNAGNGNNVRNVNPTGAVNNNNANNSNGVAPDCEDGRIKVSPSGPKSEHSRKERLSGSSDEDDEYTGIDAVGVRAGTAISGASVIPAHANNCRKIGVSGHIRAITLADNYVGEYKETVCSFGNLYTAMQICKQNVMWKDSVSGFVKNGLVNCLKLRGELMNGSYRLSPYCIFIVNEKKTRTIVATRMRDRVVQRSLCDNYLTAQISKGFIYDNCACLPGRGTDMARNRLVCHLQRHYRKHGLSGYVLKIDIHDYFGSTSHEVVKAALRKRVKDEWAVRHVESIVDSFNHIAPDRGMGLGSQITQLMQLAVLDDIDHYIKERLRIKGYVRYMDDFILIHEDKEHLKTCRREIEKRLNELGLRLNEGKTGIQRISAGIHFLGFSFRLTKTGKVVRTVLHRKISKERRKLRKLSDLVRRGQMERKHADECYKAWRAHVSKGNTAGLIRRMDAYYAGLYE